MAEWAIPSHSIRGTAMNVTVTAVSSGGEEDLSKTPADAIEVDFAGVVGDHHAGPSRKAYAGEREPRGTVLRNDRQWSAVSVEELAEMSARLDLETPIAANTLGANLCFQGIPDLSLLPRGTRFRFPSGAALTVEEYNPPCLEMSAEVAKKHATRSGASLQPGAWQRAAMGRRGIVGVVDVPGVIRVGDDVNVEVFQAPVIERS